MFFKSMVYVSNNTYNSIKYESFDKVDPNIIRFYQTEYGKDWKVALEHYIYKQNIKNNQKAA
tara:strand:+ start:138 stop:323 length:186 start_codon:yes stop_codon:yes gene_type:complete